MTEPTIHDFATHSHEPASPNTSAPPADLQTPDAPKNLPAFESIFTLVTNTSIGTTHHPHVRYIFSDDDPDVFTQALAQCESTEAQENPQNRAMMLDLNSDGDGGYKISRATSLSPSWAVLNAELSQISPPSSDGSNSGSTHEGEEHAKRPGRLMLRVEGVESSALGSEVDMALSEDQSRQGSGSRSGISSGAANSRADVPPGADNAEDYGVLIEDFQKRMLMLRKVVEAGEERRDQDSVAEPGPEISASSALQAEDSATRPLG